MSELQYVSLFIIFQLCLCQIWFELVYSSQSYHGYKRVNFLLRPSAVSLRHMYVILPLLLLHETDEPFLVGCVHGKHSFFCLKMLFSDLIWSCSVLRVTNCCKIKICPSFSKFGFFKICIYYVWNCERLKDGPPLWPSTFPVSIWLCRFNNICNSALLM